MLIRFCAFWRHFCLQPRSGGGAAALSGGGTIGALGSALGAPGGAIILGLGERAAEADAAARS